MFKQEVVFVEGVNGTGKDYFLEKSREYFPNVIPYYAPKSNFSIPINDSFVTFNTIFRSIEMNGGKPSFIYRSPITELVYDRYFGRDLSGAERLLKLFFEFLTSDVYTSRVVYLKPLHWSVVQQRRPSMKEEDLCLLDRMYHEEFAKYGVSIIYLEEFDSLLKRLDHQIESLPEKFVLVDVDNTYYQYGGSEENFRESIPVSLWEPKESVSLASIFISGRPHEEIGALQSPFYEILRSSVSYKYSLIKRLLETTDKKFILYDDYLYILTLLYEHFDLSLDKVDGKNIWRLSNC